MHEHIFAKNMSYVRNSYIFCSGKIPDIFLTSVLLNTDEYRSFFVQNRAVKDNIN